MSAQSSGRISLVAVQLDDMVEKDDLLVRVEALAGTHSG